MANDDPLALLRREFRASLDGYMAEWEESLRGALGGSKSAELATATFDESKVHRGQPGNAGEFAPGGGAKAAAPAGKPVAGKPAQGKVTVGLSDREEVAVAALLRKLKVKGLDAAGLAALAGAPGDADVEVRPGRDRKSLDVTLRNRDYSAACRLYRLGSGELVVYLDRIDVRPEAQGRGIGSEAFARQVEACRRFGVGSVRCHAARKSDRGEDAFNGYSTWPRLGFDQDLEDLEDQGDRDLAAEIGRRFPGARGVLDVQATPEGRAWWARNGTDLHKAKFDLSPGPPPSRSLLVFEAYMEERRKREARNLAASPGTPAAGKGRAEIDLSEPEEAALERAWARVGPLLRARRAGAAELATGAGEARRFGSTQFNLPAGAAGRLRAMAAAVPDGDLAEDGREDEFHVTALFGLHADVGPEDVRRAVAGFGPVAVTLGGTSVFPASEAGGEYDVVKVDVDSPDLHRLHGALAALPHTDTHPRYVPHITLAYLRPGLGAKYAGDGPASGTSLSLDTLVFSAADGARAEIPLGTSRDADDARAIAEMYAGLWNALESAGLPVPDAELEAADAELDGTGWHVAREGGGPWRAEGPEGADLSTAHAPKGGVTINGVRFAGGRFIPGAALEKATPEVKAKVEAANAAPAENRRARGDVGGKALRGRLGAHARQLTDAEAKQAARQLAALHRHHGELTLHRLEELAGVAERALAKAPPGGMLERQLSADLARLHHMTHLAEERGVTGRVAAEKVPDWPEDYDVFEKRDVFADEDVDPGTLESAAKGAAPAESARSPAEPVPTPAVPEAAAEAGAHGEAVLRGMSALARGDEDLRGGEPISVSDLRARLGMSKEAFDAAVLGLADRGLVNVQRDNGPGLRSKKELADRVTDGEGNYFVAISLREGAVPPAPAPETPAAAGPEPVAAPAAPEAPAETPVEAEAEEKAVRATGDDSRRVGADGTTYVRAPAGGATSDVNGNFYRGGRWMPIHGLSAGQEKPPKGAGGASDRPLKPNPEGKGRESRPARAPMSPEEIEDLRREREANAKWSEVRSGELGRMTSMGDRPHKLREVTNLKDWKDYAKRVGEQGLQDLITKLDPMYEEGVSRRVKSHPLGGGEFGPEDLAWALAERDRQAKDDAELFTGTKKHLKELPSSYRARQTVQEILGTADVDDLHRLNEAMQAAGKPAPDPAPPAAPAPAEVKSAPAPADNGGMEPPAALTPEVPEAPTPLPAETKAGPATPVLDPKGMSDEDLDKAWREEVDRSNRDEGLAGGPRTQEDIDRFNALQPEWYRRYEERRAAAKAARKEQRKGEAAATVKEQKEWARAGKMPDGRQMAKPGDEVRLTMPGAFGMGTVVLGKVVAGPEGKLKVEITGGGDQLGISAVGVGKTVDWTPQWTVKGDPEIERRKQERAAAERTRQEQSRKGQQDAETAAEASRAAAVAAGEEPLDPAAVKPGDVITAHWSGSPRRKVVTEIDDHGGVYARDEGEPEGTAGGFIGSPKHFTRPAGQTPAATATAPAPAAPEPTPEPAPPPAPPAAAAPSPTPAPVVKPAPAPKAAKPAPARKGRKLLSAQAISDFQPGVDKVVRKGDRTYVSHGAENVYRDVEVQSDRLTPQYVENTRKMSPDQLVKAMHATANTPYLSEEGRRERLAVMSAVAAGKPLPADLLQAYPGLAPPAPAGAPPGAPAPSPADVAAAVRGSPRRTVADVHDALRAAHPGLTLPDFHALLHRARREGLVSLGQHNDPASMTARERAAAIPPTPGGTAHLGFVYPKGVGAPPVPAPAPAPAQAPAPARDHPARVAAAFLDLDRAAGGHDLVSLAALKKATGLTVPELHAAVQDLRRRGVLTGSAFEGRHGITAEDREAVIPEPGGSGIGYVSARDHAGVAALAAATPAPAAPRVADPEAHATAFVGRKHPGGLAPLWELKRRLGLPAEAFKDLLFRLDREDKVRLVAVGDRSRLTADQLADSIDGENETFAYAEPGPAYAAPAGGEKAGGNPPTPLAPVSPPGYNGGGEATTRAGGGAMTTTVHKTTSMRSVDAYSPGSLMKYDGAWHVVAKAARRLDDQGQYVHSLTLRPASPEEAARGHVGELRRELRALSPEPDDDRDRPRVEAERRRLDNEIRRLEGRPSAESEEAAAARERSGRLSAAPFHERLSAALVDAKLPPAELAARSGVGHERLKALLGHLFDDEYDPVPAVPPTDDEAERVEKALGVRLR